MSATCSSTTWTKPHSASLQRLQPALADDRRHLTEQLKATLSASHSAMTSELRRQPEVPDLTLLVADLRQQNASLSTQLEAPSREYSGELRRLHADLATVRAADADHVRMIATLSEELKVSHSDSCSAMAENVVRNGLHSTRSALSAPAPERPNPLPTAEASDTVVNDGLNDDEVPCTLVVSELTGPGRYRSAPADDKRDPSHEKRLRSEPESLDTTPAVVGRAAALTDMTVPDVTGTSVTPE